MAGDAGLEDGAFGAVGGKGHLGKLFGAARARTLGQDAVGPADLRGKVVSLPKRADVPHPINEQLIVELCSR